MTAVEETSTEGFDPEDEDSWNFGPLSRQESVKLLKNDHTDGAFLVRESTSHQGDLVLSVRQGEQIRHYLVTRLEDRGHVEFVIGDQRFQDIPSLLEFYKTHCLENSALTHPVPDRPSKPLPAKAVVLKTHIPSIYDKKQLRLYAGDILTVTKINSNGRWEGEINGKRGSFPFKDVQFLDDW